MATNRLYRAVKEQLEADQAYREATRNNWGADKVLKHNDPILLRLREANVELQQAMAEAQTIIEAPDNRARANAVRIAGEKDIVRYMLQNLYSQGYECGGYDEDDLEVIASNDWKDVMAQTFDTDMYWITVHKDGEHIGTIMLVYGNSPEEMISDYHVSLEPILKPTFEYIKSFYDPSYIIDQGE